METLQGIISTITYHNEQNGACILQVTSSSRNLDEKFTVLVNYPSPAAGCSMEFTGNWVTHPKYGKQFKATLAIEKKPATLGAMEKYIGSGLIKGIGPKLAKRIIQKFGINTLDIFENDPSKLIQISGISKNKLDDIISHWNEQRHIRDIMLFLQKYNVSTLMCVKIYKEYGNKSIKIISEDPYRLSKDVTGIGFKTSDKLAKSMGFLPNCPERILAGIRHTLDEARNEGHCYLTLEQINTQTRELLEIDFPFDIQLYLTTLMNDKQICHRKIRIYENLIDCYYAKSLFFEEYNVAKFVTEHLRNPIFIPQDLMTIIQKMAIENSYSLSLSPEQLNAAYGICSHKFSILTGGPGCGKTTTTKVIVKTFQTLNKKILLAAPTGRAAQRMSEVIGMEAKTIHRLLVFNPHNGGFQHNAENFLEGDVLIVDECSMLDISLTNSLLKAVPIEMQVIFIGDPDQLPSVGPGNVLKDLMDSKKVPVFQLTQVFRQAQGSCIIQYAHEINKGKCPIIPTPLEFPNLWNEKVDCFFIDTEEITQEQIQMINKTKHFFSNIKNDTQSMAIIEKRGRLDKVKEIQQIIHQGNDQFYSQMLDEVIDQTQTIPDGAPKFVHHLVIPQKFSHMNPIDFVQDANQIEELIKILKKIHPYSSLNYGFTATNMLLKLYGETIPKYKTINRCKPEIQILSPMTKGSLGTIALNEAIQKAFNPKREFHHELIVAQKTFRLGDRVIQKRNNYDLNVFNGDIGEIVEIDSEEMMMTVEFPKGDSTECIDYNYEQMLDLDLAYAITIHKSQGSEFDIVIIPIFTQHFTMLFRNLIYTGLTRAKKLCIFIGSRKALALAARNIDSRKRQTALNQLIK